VILRGRRRSNIRRRNNIERRRTNIRKRNNTERKKKK
jgi:hypothetical protein